MLTRLTTFTLHSHSALTRATTPRPTTRPLTSHRGFLHKRGAKKSTDRFITGMAIDHYFALDFDGVICDSVGESSLSAWKANLELWPGSLEVSDDVKEKLLDQMSVVRPVVETGYENMLLLRVLKEKTHTVDQLLADWDNIREELLTKWELDRGELVELFGRTRDNWIKTDFEGWLAPNKFYPGVVESMRFAMASPTVELDIVTTKQARFTHALLNKMAMIALPKEKIYSTTISGAPKTEILQMLEKNDALSSATLHFVEDKLTTLEKVCKDPSLDHWKLYLVDWGYNTVAEKERAANNPRIQVINAAEFQSLMTKGV